MAFIVLIGEKGFNPAPLPPSKKKKKSKRKHGTLRRKIYS